MDELEMWKYAMEQGRIAGDARMQSEKRDKWNPLDFAEAMNITEKTMDQFMNQFAGPFLCQYSSEYKNGQIVIIAGDNVMNGVI
jgi:hypothetical protein